MDTVYRLRIRRKYAGITFYRMRANEHEWKRTPWHTVFVTTAATRTYLGKVCHYSNSTLMSLTRGPDALPPQSAELGAVRAIQSGMSLTTYWHCYQYAAPSVSLSKRCLLDIVNTRTSYSEHFQLQPLSIDMEYGRMHGDIRSHPNSIPAGHEHN